MNPQALFSRLKQPGQQLQQPSSQSPEEVLKIYQQLQKVMTDANDQKQKMEVLEKKVKEVERYNTELETKITDQKSNIVRSKIPLIPRETSSTPFLGETHQKNQTDHQGDVYLDPEYQEFLRLKHQKNNGPLIDMKDQFTLNNYGKPSNDYQPIFDNPYSQNAGQQPPMVQQQIKKRQEQEIVEPFQLQKMQKTSTLNIMQQYQAPQNVQQVERFPSPPQPQQYQRRTSAVNVNDQKQLIKSKMNQNISISSLHNNNSQLPRGTDGVITFKASINAPGQDQSIQNEFKKVGNVYVSKVKL